MTDPPIPGTHFNAAGETRKVVGIRHCWHAYGCAQCRIQWTDSRGKVYEGSIVEWRKWKEKKNGQA